MFATCWAADTTPLRRSPPSRSPSRAPRLSWPILAAGSLSQRRESRPILWATPTRLPLDAIFTLRRQYGLRADNVERIVVRLPVDGASIVNNSPMADVNCQHLIATALVDGSVSFSNSHSHEHMADPQIRAVMQRVQVVGDPKLTADHAAPRSGLVEVTLRDGRTVSHFTRFPPGTKENPLDTEGMNAKARGLMEPVLGSKRTEAIIQRVNALEEVGNMRELVRSLLTV